MPFSRIIPFFILCLPTPGFGQLVPAETESSPDPGETVTEVSVEEAPEPSEEDGNAEATEGDPTAASAEIASESEAPGEPSIAFPVGAPRSRPEDPADQKGVFEGRAGTFEFVAADQTSLQIARKIGREVLEVCDGMITPPQERIPRIDVKLAPDGRGNLGDKPFDIYRDLAGDYGLAVRWNETLPASLFIRALTESYLKQLVFTLAGKDRSEKVPSWMIAGSSLRVQLAFRPELVEFLKQIGRDMPMPALDTVFQERPLSRMTLQEQVAAFWFLELLDDSLPTQKRYRAFFDEVVVGGAPAMETLQKQTDGLQGFDNGLEAWWIIGFQDQVNDESGIVFSISRSAKLVFLLNRFELLRNGTPEFSGAEEMWEVREDPVVQKELRRRLQGIRSILPRINPVFYNSLRGLGLVIQALLDGTREEFDQAVEDFLEEVEQSAALAKDAQLLGEDPQAVLRGGNSVE